MDEYDDVRVNVPPHAADGASRRAPEGVSDGRRHAGW
jgi:hypothetical protein